MSSDRDGKRLAERVRVAKHPRFVPPGTLVEITSRTNGARLYLRPSPELNAAILAILGRALAHYPIALHAFVFLSNHWHALVTPADAQALADFMRYVHGNVAKAAQEHNGVRGTVWQRRAQIIPVLDEHAQLNRLRYVLAHGTKEHREE
jgi:REP element-mobilizing transposase RayT